MPRRWMLLCWALPCAFILLGCASNSKPPEPVVLRPPPEIVTKNVYPDIPADWLQCALDPEIPAMITKDTDIPYQELEDAWSDCFTKIERLKALVQSWPKE